MASNYRRGYSAEDRVRRAFAELGWLVIRAAGSKGPTDICVVSRDGQVGLIQVKSGKARVSPDERSQLTALAQAFPLCRVEVWHWKDRRWEITHFGGVGSPEGELVRIAGKGEGNG